MPNFCKLKRCLLLLGFILTACGTPPPTPTLDIQPGADFTLAVGQSAVIAGTGLTVTLTGVPGDQRCPLNIECAISGPVTATITVQSGIESPQEFSFTTFTDNDGSVPSVDFQGMQTRAVVGGYVIQVKSILPFPQNKMGEIKDFEYRVLFVVQLKMD